MHLVAEPDSTTEAYLEEETYYRINVLRLQRYVRENIDTFDDPVLSKEIVRLIKEADCLAKDGDFYRANAWLETVWELLDPAWQDIEEEGEDYVPGEFTVSPSLPFMAQTSKSQWSKQIITGVDLWQQEFNFRFLQNDSSFSEGSGNPFTGVRLNFDYDSGRGSRFQTLTAFKYSRDYLSGEATARYSGRIGASSRWRIENRFEGTSFYRDFDLKYLQNLTSVAIAPRFGLFTLELEDEFIIRRYAGSDSTYPNYFGNSLRLLTKFSLSAASLLGLGYRNVVRMHTDFDINDYKENRFEFDWVQAFGSSLGLSLADELRFRDYTNAPVDHFYQDFWENYFRGEMEFRFTPGVAFKLNGSVSNRDYEFVSVNSLPDYVYWEVEPEFSVKLGPHWRVGVGFHYDKQTHQKLANRFSNVDDVLSTFSIQFEDYYSYGPMLAVEFFDVNGLMFSVRESFLLRRYPNTPTRDVAEFNLYSDTNTNSILMFLAWNISRNWQLNLLANVDDDKSQKDDSGDSRNTLVGLEIGYSF